MASVLTPFLLALQGSGLDAIWTTQTFDLLQQHSCHIIMVVHVQGTGEPALKGVSSGVPLRGKQEGTEKNTGPLLVPSQCPEVVRVWPIIDPSLHIQAPSTVPAPGSRDGMQAKEWKWKAINYL